MEEEKEDRRSDVFNTLQDSRITWGLIKSILKNNEVVEEFIALSNKKKWWKPAKDVNLAKRLIFTAGDVIKERYWKEGDLEGKDRWKVVTEILLEAGNIERAKEASKAARIWRTTGVSKEGQLAGIKKQLEEVRKQLALLVVAMGTASPKQEAEAKRIINLNKVRVEEEKRKEAEGKKIQDRKRQVEERRKKKEEVLKEAEKLVAQAQAGKDAQKKVAKACEEEVDFLRRVNRDNFLAKDLIKLGEKLNEAMEMKKKIEEERNREVENKVGNKKQVVNRKILKTVRIVVAHMNLIDGRGKVEMEKVVGETSKLLDVLAQTNRMLG